jgi:SAM-dependent methyltransferase
MVNEQWKQYQVIDKPPSHTALKVLELFNEDSGKISGHAIDLGCGVGADSLLMLQNDWHVTAIDIEIFGITKLKEKLEHEVRENLLILEQAFETLHLQQSDWINASFSIPFCKPKSFERLWYEITTSLRSGGHFSGILLGERDSWAKHFEDERTFHTYSEIHKMLIEFDVELFNEIEREGYCMGESGERVEKHWHYYEIVARKR